MRKHVCGHAPTIDIRESRAKIEQGQNLLACGCRRKSSKSREEACATLQNTEQATTQNKPRPTGSDVIQWESVFIKQYLYAN